jgi:SAM-dependent methyltransferase
MVVGYYLQKDLRANLAGRRHRTPTLAVHTGGHEQLIEKAASEARKIFDQVLHFSGLSSLSGLRVLELGPGDDLGIAMLFKEAGADATVCDRFLVRRDPTRLSALAGALGLPGDPRPTVVDGVGAERAADHFGHQSFDLVYSIAVLEHVSDLDAALDSVMALVRPGGAMVHYIGGGDHGMFGGHHPLTYLRVPRPIYRAMTSHSGGPNRVYPSDVRRVMERSRWPYSLSLTQVMTRPFLSEAQALPVDVTEYPDLVEDVERIRSRLREPYRSLPASELLVEGALLVAHPPGPEPGHAARAGSLGGSS